VLVDQPKSVTRDVVYTVVIHNNGTIAGDEGFVVPACRASQLIDIVSLHYDDHPGPPLATALESVTALFTLALHASGGTV